MIWIHFIVGTSKFCHVFGDLLLQKVSEEHGFYILLFHQDDEKEETNP